MIFDGFHTEPGNLSSFLLWNHYFGAAVFEIVDRHLNNAFGIFHGMMLVEFYMHNIVLFHPGHWVGGDQFCVKAFGDIGQILEYALNINHHRLTGTGDDRQLLLQEGTCRRHTVALKDFVARRKSELPDAWY